MIWEECQAGTLAKAHLTLHEWLRRWKTLLMPMASHLLAVRVKWFSPYRASCTISSVPWPVLLPGQLTKQRLVSFTLQHDVGKEVSLSKLET